MKIDIEKIKTIARKAGKEILKYYVSDFEITEKENKTPLTEADLSSNEIIMSELEKYGIPILSEESADDKKRLESEKVFIVDPLDGTSDFIQKNGEFSVMIGLVRNGEPILGVIYAPATKEMYFAEKGKGAYLEKDGKKTKLNVSKKKDFPDMTILLSRSHLLPLEEELSLRLNLKRKTQGSAGLKMCKIAAGEAEIYINSSDRLGEWDTCAGSIILQEAGGSISDLEGMKTQYNKESPKHLNGCLASNGIKHNEIINTL